MWRILKEGKDRLNTECDLQGGEDIRKAGSAAVRSTTAGLFGWEITEILRIAAGVRLRSSVGIQRALLCTAKEIMAAVTLAERG